MRCLSADAKKTTGFHFARNHAGGHDHRAVVGRGDKIHVTERGYSKASPGRRRYSSDQDLAPGVSRDQRILSYDRAGPSGFGGCSLNRSPACSLATIHGGSSNRSLGYSLRLSLPRPEESNQIRFVLGRSGSNSRYERRRSGTITLRYSSESSGGGTFGVGATGVGFRWITPR